MQNATFSDAVRLDLAHCVDLVQPAEPLTATSSPAVWHDALKHIGGRVAGIMLVRPLWSYDVLKVLDKSERELADCGWEVNWFFVMFESLRFLTHSF
jgi:hypothetical protein